MLGMALVLWMALPMVAWGQGITLDDSEFQRDMEVLRSKPRWTEVWVDASAYTASSDECGKGDGITASGVVAVEGVTIACDDLPFGTVVELDGHTYIVQDRYGGGYVNRIDVFMDSKISADEFGREKLLMKIKE